MIIRTLISAQGRSHVCKTLLGGFQSARHLALLTPQRPLPIIGYSNSLHTPYSTQADKPSRKPSVTFQEHAPPNLGSPVPGGILSRLLPAALIPEAGSASSLRKLVALAGPERKTIAGAVGLLLVSSSVSMSIPFTIGRLMDYFSNPNPELFFGLSPTTALVALLMVFTTGALANTGRVLLFKSAGFRIVARLRSQGYRAALRQDIEYVERGVGEGDLVSRLNNDSGIVGESITQNLSDGLRSIVTASVGLTAMFWLSPTMTLLMLSIVPPVMLGAVFYGRYLKRISNRTQEAIGDMSKAAQESLHSLRTVQSFGGYPIEERRFDSEVNKVVDLNRKEALASAIFFGSTGWSGNVTVLMLLGYGGTLVSRGEISVGDLTSLLLYTAYVGSSLGSLSIMKGIGAGSRVFGLLERDPLIPYASGAPFPKPNPAAGDHMATIQFNKVSFSYPSRPKVTVLKDFDLELKSGESVALVGRSGSGKSSVDNLLLRFYDPTSGTITYDGRDIKEFNVNSWRSGLIGLVPQEPTLFTGTIRSNISYGNPDASQAQVEEAARQANCEFIWDLPNGFDTEVGRASLSGGQKQRIAIARALLPKPSLLVLDEATSALDAASELQVNDAIDRILRQGNLTCLIVAHRLSTIARADRVVVLDGGRIVEQGLFHELATRDGSKFRELMKAQFSAASPTRLNSPEASTIAESEDDEVAEGSMEEIMSDDRDESSESAASKLP
ncbi:ATP-binding cassette permease mdl1 [Tulasnella sp. JGI-2019a]|nr:ATP-binding cassette permease mdl1 [Tulasnella sp. JGI-2019a]